MIVTTLGTNGWFDTENGQTMCTLIRTQNYSVILDAGFGIRRAKDLIDFSKPAYLLLSHLHLDHTIGLHTLDYLQLQLPLTIVVPAGQKQAVEELVAVYGFADAVVHTVLAAALAARLLGETIY